MEKNSTNSPKNNPKSEKPGLSVIIADHKAEFKKIIWPKKDEVVKKTATVVVTSLVIGVIIFCMDTVYNAGVSAAMHILGLI
ncbi:MAG: preprotein translocase subunit SecE [Firmicutes bacterium]|nr:preprotein translocase subunit SecE [Bacillota bacterium]